jgi:hypothetical protein
MKYGACKLRSPHAKEFMQKLSAHWARFLKKIRQTSPRLKKFKKYITFKGHQIISLP